MIKLNSTVTDNATGLKGIVTMMHIEMGGETTYLFQPSILSRKTKLPIDPVWAVADRLRGGEQIDPPDLPLSVLGTQVEDTATGFRGMAVSLALHATGCVHFNVQPNGRDEEDNPVRIQNFSILRLKGKALKTLSDQEQRVEQLSKPSPGPAMMPLKIG